MYRMGTSGEKGMRCEPSTMPVAVCTLLYPQAKAGHWETEKAGYSLKVRVGRPALMLFRTCHWHRNDSTLSAQRVLLLWGVVCDAQEYCCGNFKIAAAIFLKG